MDERSNEEDGFCRGGRMRRRRGGVASGMLERPRLDRPARKPSGGGPLGEPSSVLRGSAGPSPLFNVAPRGGRLDGPPESAIPEGAKQGGRLTASARHALPKSDFALPGQRYPVNDANHARAALSRVSQFGSGSEKAAVRAKVRSKFPGIDSG